MTRWIAQRPTGREAAIGLLYILGGSARIVGSDLYIHDYSQDHLDGLWESIAKGLGFVACTGLVLFLVLRRSYLRIEDE